MLLKCLLLCAVQLISHICLAGITLYVNPDGKENAAGTADDPCKTLVEVMKKGDTEQWRYCLCRSRRLR